MINGILNRCLRLRDVYGITYLLTAAELMFTVLASLKPLKKSLKHWGLEQRDKFSWMLYQQSTAGEAGHTYMS